MATVTPETADYVLGCLHGYQMSSVIGSACKLEIFDLIHDAGGAVTIETLAQSKKWQRAATKRLLDALATLKFLQKSQVNGTDSYSLTNHGNYLRRRGDITVWGAYTMTECFRANYDNIPNEITAPEPSAGEAGEQAAAQEEEEEEHDGEAMSEDDWRSMSGFLDPYLPDIVSAFDLGGLRVAYDLGGGIGNLARALCRKYPDMEVTVLEKENVVKAALEMHPKMTSPEEQLKVKYDSVDFFAGELPAADLYVCCQTARHFTEKNWQDFMTKTLKQLNPGGVLMILESTFEDNRVGPSHINLLEMCFAAWGSRFLTITEYRELFKKHGYVDFEFKRIGKRCDVSIIYGRKPN